MVFLIHTSAAIHAIVIRNKQMNYGRVFRGIRKHTHTYSHKRTLALSHIQLLLLEMIRNNVNIGINHDYVFGCVGNGQQLCTDRR